MNHFDNVTQYQQLSVFFKLTKNHLHRFIYHAEFSTYAKFHTCRFTQRNVRSNACLLANIFFFLKIYTFVVAYRTIFP